MNSHSAQWLRLLCLTGGVLGASQGMAAQWSPSAGTCQQMTQHALPGVKITQAERVKAGKVQLDKSTTLTGASGDGLQLPAHCLVRGMIGAHTGPDGKEYGIRFELRMPDNWQGRFMFQGGGGLDGFLGQAIGSVPSHGSTATPSLVRGYAVVSMDGGHEGRDASFAVDQQARLDYAYAAIGKVTQQAKYLVDSYYAAPIRYSYFMGCSNGGREAMLAAQRYPTEFNGVVVGNPGFHLSWAAIGEAWDTQKLLAVAPKDAQGRPVLSQALTQSDLTLVSQAVLNACDDKDGLKDGIINNYPACHFDPVVLQCQSDQTANCLSAEKIKALKLVFGGAKDSAGNALYSGWPYDSGVNAPGWRMWKLGSSTDATKPNALNIILGTDSLFHYYMTPAQSVADMTKFDFDRDPAKTNEMGALNDAIATEMSTYVARGGKMVIFQGLSDPVFSASDIQKWYETTTANTSKGDINQQRDWSRLFMVPGMNHCGDGPALDNFDPLTAIQAWVEINKAPASLPATGKAFPGKHQPICAYPQTAHYTGGDVNKLSSYRCL
ncbi:tannase/feruloyl esterase family alpha/beta hydrolase [Tolumonas lignilytica]|uniref:tannase/feruloyl esterase family alpha/beta hydrolase n=1 Tax=Tolumonas lignilytica TaxID=1283284 RepID=UPI000462FB37|nr:tannase/feruloyl esterase family alpha/beta hydrolase [Tolumonas lignilytica]